MAFSEAQRREIFANANARCEHCGAKWSDGVMLECHHIVPLCEGGANLVCNGVLVCRRCHANAHDARAKEARRRGDKKAESDNARASASIRSKPKMRTGY